MPLPCNYEDDENPYDTPRNSHVKCEENPYDIPKCVKSRVSQFQKIISQNCQKDSQDGSLTMSASGPDQTGLKKTSDKDTVMKSNGGLVSNSRPDQPGLFIINRAFQNDHDIDPVDDVGTLNMDDVEKLDSIC
jgi:hypothetical protein